MSASASPHVKPRNLPPSGGGGSQRGAYVVGGVGDPTELCIARYPLEKLKEKLPLRTESFFASRGYSVRNWGVEVL